MESTGVQVELSDGVIGVQVELLESFTSVHVLPPVVVSSTSVHVKINDCPVSAVIDTPVKTALKEPPTWPILPVIGKPAGTADKFITVEALAAVISHL